MSRTRPAERSKGSEAFPDAAANHLRGGSRGDECTRSCAGTARTAVLADTALADNQSGFPPRPKRAGVSATIFSPFSACTRRRLKKTRCVVSKAWTCDTGQSYTPKSRQTWRLGYPLCDVCDQAGEVVDDASEDLISGIRGHSKPRHVCAAQRSAVTRPYAKLCTMKI